MAGHRDTELVPAMPRKALRGIAGTGNMPCHLAARGRNRRSLDHAANERRDERGGTTAHDDRDCPPQKPYKTAVYVLAHDTLVVADEHDHGHQERRDDPVDHRRVIEHLEGFDANEVDRHADDSCQSDNSVEGWRLTKGVVEAGFPAQRLG